MFCPLCKAEYRQGFTQCSDCHIALVATLHEAQSVPVECLWDGSDRAECNRILTGLMNADIPYFSRETVKSELWPWLSLLLVRFMRPKPTYDLKVWVLQRDLDRARGHLRREGEESEEEDRSMV